MDARIPLAGVHALRRTTAKQSPMFASRVNSVFEDDSHYTQTFLFDDACMQTRGGVDLFVAGFLTIRFLSRLPDTQPLLLLLFSAAPWMRQWRQTPGTTGSSWLTPQARAPHHSYTCAPAEPPPLKQPVRPRSRWSWHTWGGFTSTVCETSRCPA